MEAGHGKTGAAGGSGCDRVGVNRLMLRIAVGVVVEGAAAAAGRMGEGKV